METFANFISEQALPSFAHLCHLVSEEQDALVIDGVKAFNPKSQFVEGKVVNAFSYLLVDKKDTPEFPKLAAEFQTVIQFVAGRTFETWGTLNCLTGLYRLAQNNLLDELVPASALAQLKVGLNWHHFVDEKNNYALIHKPTNYYGVAFGIARYHELLGWSNEQYSERFLTLLMKHIRKFSGEHMIMDETQGAGRFDRYSLLIPAELANLLTETQVPVPTEIIQMLKKSVAVCLMIANEKGDGIMYGRSIGAYGDTAVLEILSIANRLELLNEKEQVLAFGYSEKIIEKFRSFWFNPQTKQVNMWDFGRQTDGYRNKNRILGETLSLQLQILHSIENFQHNPLHDAETGLTFSEILSQLPMYQVFTFDESKGPKLLVVVRTAEHVFMVPFINGGEKYYETSPYLPMPMSTDFLEFTPDVLKGNLVPLLTQGTASYLPLAPFATIEVTAPAKQQVAIQFSTMQIRKIGVEVEESLPISYQGTYLFTPSSLTIKGVVKGAGLVKTKLALTLPLFTEVKLADKAKFIDKNSENHTIEWQNFDMIEEQAVNASDYQTPHGSHKSVLIGHQQPQQDETSFAVQIEF